MAAEGAGQHIGQVEHANAAQGFARGLVGGPGWAAVGGVREASTKSRDPDVKAFAGKTLPTLQHHLEMANKMANEVGKSPAKSAKR
ncbi:DUF4142 domain-containing protein [Burkholderia cenocepacia]|uniref:DUF4142 domain-containing protein n=1 Tax=Burkholderia cenocepacia TaxID=95486 RepID=UPI0029F57176|nr:DUF4142 domain-containing protein [Burkholderia cenocepacia]